MRAYSLRFAAAAAAAALLAGCTGMDSPETSTVPKHLRPLSYATVKELEEKGMSKYDPVLIRIYKQDSEFEVWKKRKSDGRYAHFKTYKICKWSGDLGPKTKEGDRQSPEGFYTVTPGQMNPNSAWYLSFNVGYPNSFDRALNRTGSAIMVHGNCSSRGCFSMTDAQIQEIYALMRDAFQGGQKAVQVQSFPFHMTAENLVKHRGDPNMPFWRNLKEGSDHFEVTGLEPKVDACGKRYVFDAEAPGSFSPTSACPAYHVKPEIATAVAAKEKKDERQEQVLLAQLEKGAPANKGFGLGTLFAGADRPAAAAPAPNAVRATTPVQAVSTAPTPARQAASEPQVASASQPVSGPQSSGSLFSAWTHPAAQPAAAPSSSALVAPATQPAEGSSTGAVKGFFSRILGRDEAPPAETAAPPAEPASAPVPLPAPKPHEKSARRKDAKPAVIGGAQPILPSVLAASR